MVTETIASDSVVSYPNQAGIDNEAWKELVGEWVFKKTITYRRYDLDDDNITGDQDRSSYTDYTIYAEVQFQEVGDKLVKMGQLEEGDAEVFIPVPVYKDTSGDAITESFRPHTHDDILYEGYTWRINKITFERSGTIEIFADCQCKRISAPAGYS